MFVATHLRFILFAGHTYLFCVHGTYHILTILLPFLFGIRLFDRAANVTVGLRTFVVCGWVGGK